MKEGFAQDVSRNMTQPRFLDAEWRMLAMLNYEVDSGVVSPLVPAGCELDTWNGRTFLSVVGFLFLRTRVRGVPIPFHRDFEEVNLRFYVRHKAGDEWRRGVVFVKELVPRWAIAWVARTAYHENYVALPMRHELTSSGLRYEWCRDRVWEGLSATLAGEPMTPPENAEESFITEHYWGYAAQPDGVTLEYQVEHPRWAVWRAESAALDCDVRALYGPAFVESLSGEPTTAFVADGSHVVVRHGRRLA